MSWLASHAFYVDRKHLGLIENVLSGRDPMGYILMKLSPWQQYLVKRWLRDLAKVDGDKILVRECQITKRKPRGKGMIVVIEELA